jgi:uncharacterized HAD superfamily protein
LEKLNIGVDIDGVIVDFITEFIKAYHKKYPRFKKITKENIRCHNIGSMLGLFDEEITDLIEYTTIYTKFPLIEGADKVLYELALDNNIIICTSRPERHYEYTIKLLRDYDIPYNKLIFRGNGKKLDVILKEMPRFDIFIEDNIAEAVNLSKLVKQVLVYRQPWNEKCLNVRGNLKFVDNWEQINQAIENYKKDLHPSLL